MTLLVVPIGESGSGKSTVAELACQSVRLRGFTAQTMAFAQPLKDFCKEVFRFSDIALFGPPSGRNAEDNRYRRQWGAISAWYDARLRLEAAAPAFVDSLFPESLRQEAHTRLVHDWFVDLFHHSLSSFTPRHCLQTLGTEWGRALDEKVWINYLRAKVQKSGADVVVATDGRFLNEAMESGGVPWLIRRDAPSMLGTAHASEKDQGSNEMFDYCLKNGVVIYNDKGLPELQEKVDRIVAIATKSLRSQPKLWGSLSDPYLNLDSI